MIANHISQDEADEFALGVLEPEAMAKIAEHSADCPECQRLVDNARAFTGQLALAAPSHQAPPALKDRVLRETGISRPPAWRRAASHWRAATTIAAAIAAIVALAGMLTLRSQVSDLKNQNNSLRTQVNQSLAQQQASIGDRSLLLAMLSPDSVMAPIRATTANTPAVGRLVWNDQQQKCWLVFDRLAALPPGQTYQLWVRADGRLFSLGTFKPDATGLMQYTVTVRHDIDSYEAAVITVQNAGGSKTATGPTVFTADLSAADAQYR